MNAEYFNYPVFYLSNYFSPLFCYSWSKKPNEWKFQKTRQTWLLLHMYDKEKVPDEYFSVLLDYLEGLKGSARDVTMQKAEALIKEYDSSDEEDPGLLEKCERIRKVLQLLS
uniref:Chromosome 7 open reading frame 50 n=1 Tax=Pelusios castaneus TaxID=367368 RepID=A0A8C8SIW9_9SAUR